MIKLDIESAVYALMVLPKLLGYDKEPMPKLTEKNIDELEACLNLPFQKPFGHEKYKTIAEKAAAQMYFIAKGHKLENGNKRTAVALMLLLLNANGYWLEFTSSEMYKIALDVAESKAKDVDNVVVNLAKKIEEKLVPLPDDLGSAFQKMTDS